MIPAHQPLGAAANLAAQIAAQFTAPSDADSDESSPYRQRLYPWLIVRHLPQMQRLVVCRFRKRNDAEQHLNVLRRLDPSASYLILFDPTDEA